MRPVAETRWVQVSAFGKLHGLIARLGLVYIFLLPFYDVPQPLRAGIAASGIAAVLVGLLILARELAAKNTGIAVPLAMVIPFAAFLSFYLLAALANIHQLHPKAFNHIFFYLYTFVVYAIVPFMLMRIVGTLIFSRCLALSVALVALIGLCEVSIFYLRGFEAYRDFLSHGSAVGTFGDIPRMRSTFNEPSHLALFLLPVFPLLVWAGRPVALALAAFSFVATLSVSAFSGVIAAGGLLFLFHFVRFVAGLRFKRREARLLGVLAPIAVFGLAVFAVLFYEPFVEKTTGVASVDPTRWTAWVASVEAVDQSPLIGAGPAAYYKFAPSGVFNWYLQVAVEAGLAAVLFIALMFVVVLVVGVRARIPLICFSVLAVAGQMVFMNHYYIPGFWILIAFVFARSAEKEMSGPRDQPLVEKDGSPSGRAGGKLLGWLP